MIAPRTTWDLEVRPSGPAGQHAWLETLHVDHGPGLRQMLRRILGNEEEALDAYQECMYHLARRCDQVRLRNVPAYAYRTAANLATEVIRRRVRQAAHWGAIVADRRIRHDPPETARAHQRDADRQRVLLGLRRAVGRLPRHLRDVIVLRDLAQLPYRQVARMLGIQATTARVYRRQAVLRLTDTLGLQGPGNRR